MLSWTKQFDLFTVKSIGASVESTWLQRLLLMRDIALNIGVDIGSHELLKHAPIGKQYVSASGGSWPDSFFHPRARIFYLIFKHFLIFLI
jgi:hypothetical protein